MIYLEMEDHLHSLYPTSLNCFYIFCHIDSKVNEVIRNMMVGSYSAPSCG